MNYIKIFTGGMLLLLSLTSCKKYLGEEPKKQTSIQNLNQLEALLNNPVTRESNTSAAYSTDDCEIPADLYKNNVSRFTIDYMYYYTFETEIITGLAADGLWADEYSKIFKANLVLANVDEVTGDPAAKAITKADAHFLRAYSYWVLANNYCQPYQPGVNDKEQGLPLKKTTLYEESLVRATLKETYDFILADIAEAQKTAIDDVQDKLRWRLSKKAISAFLSRYYLFLGDYDKCLEHTNDALGSTNAKLVDFKTILAGNSNSYTNPVAKLEYSELNDWGTSKYYYWKEQYYTRYAYVATQWFLPSSSLIALYDQTNDLRYKWFMIPNGGRRFSVVTPPAYRYTMFDDGRSLVAGPTVAEMLLNKAEALIRKSEGNIVAALEAVNMLREKRLTNIDPLVATTAADALKKILEERRREIPFAMRWYDIRRFSVNTDPSDDVTVTRNFFQVNLGAIDVNTPKTYTLPVGSRRYAVPINGVEIAASKDQIEQNKY